MTHYDGETAFMDALRREHEMIGRVIGKQPVQEQTEKIMIQMPVLNIEYIKADIDKMVVITVLGFVDRNVFSNPRLEAHDNQKPHAGELFNLDFFVTVPVNAPIDDTLVPVCCSHTMSLNVLNFDGLRVYGGKNHQTVKWDAHALSVEFKVSDYSGFTHEAFQIEDHE